MGEHRQTRLVTILSLAIAVGVGLAACGIKGSLEPPAAAKADPAAKSDSGQGKAEGEAPKPHRDFLLDGLIR